MKEYEVLVESMTPCGGAKHAIKEFLEVEADSPEAWVRQNGRFPIIDTVEKAGGDLVITTADCAGNTIRYTFSE